MTGSRRKFIYIACYIWSCIRGIIFTFGLKLRKWLLPPPTFHGIAILDMHPATKSTDFFLEQTKKALQLISETDPRRFKIVTSQIRIIINDHLPSFSAFYHRRGRICDVDLSKLPFESRPEWSVKEYACTIIHEATHGRLFQQMIPYTKKTRSRIEKICVDESRRFAGKWEADSFDWESYFKIVSQECCKKIRK